MVTLRPTLGGRVLGTIVNVKPAPCLCVSNSIQIPMIYLIEQTEVFAKWRAGLKDLKAATAIRRRLERAQAGNLGDTKTVGESVSEMRLDIGPGYRLYFTVRQMQVMFLLVGGTKSSQQADIQNAIQLAKEF